MHSSLKIRKIQPGLIWGTCRVKQNYILLGIILLNLLIPMYMTKLDAYGKEYAQWKNYCMT